MWSNLLTGVLAVACIALALALSRMQSPPVPSSELHAQVPVVDTRISTDLAGRAETPSPPAERLLDEQLPEFRLDRVPFDVALDTLAQTVKANLIVDWVAIEGSDIKRDAPVRVHLYSVSVRGALRAILGCLPHVPNRPVFYADGDLIRVTTSDYLPSPRTTVIYDVTDLLNRLGNVPAGRAGPSGNRVNADNLTELIVQNVEPDSWQENGGRASIRALAGRLVVTQTPENHGKVAQLLRQLAAGGEPILPTTQPTPSHSE